MTVRPVACSILMSPIGGDPKHWLEKQLEIESVARSRGIKLDD